MMFGCNDEVLSSSVSDQINPRFGIPILGSEVRKEVIIVCPSKGLELVVVYIGLVRISVIIIPPVPLCVYLPGSGIALKEVC
jgi:hypothetical protein